MLKPKLLAFLTILCILAAACSLADTARVVTPGGKLNMRKSLKGNAKLVTYVPNRSMVEVEEIDGEWTKIIYHKKTGYINLDQSGCAIYALSHALNRMGETDDDIHPTRLAKTFSLCLTADGTNNERLLREASEIYPFTTARDLIENKKKIAQLLQDGCMFSFSVIRGHIAMISGISDDGAMVRVVDSAPTATFERLVNASIYYQTRSGSWRIASSLSEIEGAR